MSDVRIPLPPGCYGIKMGSSGREYNNAGPGGTVTIDERHAAEIAGSAAGINGIITTQRLTGIATRVGRMCTKRETCPGGRDRTWNAWNLTCPRCGSPTAELHRPQMEEAQ